MFRITPRETKRTETGLYDVVVWTTSDFADGSIPQIICRDCATVALVVRPSVTKKIVLRSQIENDTTCTMRDGNTRCRKLAAL